MHEKFEWRQMTLFRADDTIGYGGTSDITCKPKLQTKTVRINTVARGSHYSPLRKEV